MKLSAVHLKPEHRIKEFATALLTEAAFEFAPFDGGPWISVRRRHDGLVKYIPAANILWAAPASEEPEAKPEKAAKK